MSKKEKSELEKFTTLSLRGPKQGVYEQLACLKLLHANRTNPLQRIRMISEAAWFTKPKAIDMDLVQLLYEVSVALGNASSNQYYPGSYQPSVKIHHIPWPFNTTKENFERYIKPWLKSYSYYPSFIKVHRSLRVKVYHSEDCGYLLGDFSPESTQEQMKAHIIEKYGSICPECGEHFYSSKYTFPRRELRFKRYMGICPEPNWSFFFEAATCLSEQGFKELVGAFVSWGDPKATKIESTIAGLINPQTFMEFFRKEEQEEAETELEGSLGPRK